MADAGQNYILPTITVLAAICLTGRLPNLYRTIHTCRNQISTVTAKTVQETKNVTRSNITSNAGNFYYITWRLLQDLCDPPNRSTVSTPFSKQNDTLTHIPRRILSHPMHLELLPKPPSTFLRYHITRYTITANALISTAAVALRDDVM